MTIGAALVAPLRTLDCLNPLQKVRDAAALEVIPRHMIQKVEGMQCLYQETQLHGSARNIASFAAGKEVLLEIMEPGRDRIYQVASLLVDSICTRHVSHYDKLVTCHVCLTDHRRWNRKFQTRYISMAVLNSNCGDMTEGSRVIEDPRDAYPQRNVSLRPRSLGENCSQAVDPDSAQWLHCLVDIVVINDVGHFGRASPA